MQAEPVPPPPLQQPMFIPVFTPMEPAENERIVQMKTIMTAMEALSKGYELMSHIFTGKPAPQQLLNFQMPAPVAPTPPPPPPPPQVEAPTNHITGFTLFTKKFKSLFLTPEAMSKGWLDLPQAMKDKFEMKAFHKRQNIQKIKKPKGQRRKRSQCGYTVYLKDQFKLHTPNREGTAGPGDIMKKIAAQWKAMSAEERRVFEVKASLINSA